MEKIKQHTTDFVLEQKQQNEEMHNTLEVASEKDKEWEMVCTVIYFFKRNKHFLLNSDCFCDKDISKICESKYLCNGQESNNRTNHINHVTV